MEKPKYLNIAIEPATRKKLRELAELNGKKIYKIIDELVEKELKKLKEEAVK